MLTCWHGFGAVVRAELRRRRRGFVGRVPVLMVLRAGADESCTGVSTIMDGHCARVLIGVQLCFAFEGGVA